MSNYKTLIENFSYLSLIQVFNFISPILLLPYLIKVLGTDIYGEIIYAQTIVNYLLIIVIFGFNLSAVKEISLNRENKLNIDIIFSNIISIKLILLFITLIILVIITKIVDNNFVDHRLLLLTSWILFYDLFFPTWYFQGIEKMGFITLLTLLSKSIFFVSVFVFIKSSNDFLLYPIIQMVGSIVTGIGAYYIIFKMHNLKIIKPEIKKMKKYFYESTHIFFSNIFQTIFINTNKIIIGKFLGMSQVTYYDLAEKIYSLSKIPQVISGQVIFPKISKDRDLKFIFKFLRYLLVLNLIIMTICFISSNYISQLFLGSEIAIAIFAINLMLLMLPLSTIHNIFGVQILISFGFSKIYTRIIFLSLLLYSSIILTLGYLNLINLISLIFSLIITEIFISIFLIYEYRKKIKK